jgi:hypothetical protein
MPVIGKSMRAAESMCGAESMLVAESMRAVEFSDLSSVLISRPLSWRLLFSSLRATQKPEGAKDIQGLAALYLKCLAPLRDFVPVK